MWQAESANEWRGIETKRDGFSVERRNSRISRTNSFVRAILSSARIEDAGRFEHFSWLDTPASFDTHTLREREREVSLQNVHLLDEVGADASRRDA